MTSFIEFIPRQKNKIKQGRKKKSKPNEKIVIEIEIKDRDDNITLDK